MNQCAKIVCRTEQKLEVTDNVTFNKMKVVESQS